MPGRSPTAPSWRREIVKALRDRRATVGVVGLGYVGLPMLVWAARAGFRAVGLDIDPARVKALSEGRSYVSDVPDRVLADIRSFLRVSTKPSTLKACDVVLICVPTPLTDLRPDLGFIERAGKAVARSLRPGVLVVLESTTYPGTTEEVLRPILETSGLRAGRDFALAYSPERIDPGRELDHIAKTPKVVGGLTKRDGELAARFYRSFIHEVDLVSTPREAEMAKLIENTFRHVNIALVNELAILSEDLGVDLWEAIGAASTKPFGFMPFWPGPGVGGHCIAIDPSYLAWRVGQRTGQRLNFVEHAQEVNARMPRIVAQRVSQALNDQGKPLRGSRVLGVGVTYKQDVNDMRESPALIVLERLSAEGAKVEYHDPYVPSLQLGRRRLRSKALTPGYLASQDVAVVLTAHSSVDFAEVVRQAPLVVDTRGVTRGRHPNVVRL